MSDKKKVEGSDLATMELLTERRARLVAELQLLNMQANMSQEKLNKTVAELQALFTKNGLKESDQVNLQTGEVTASN